MVRVVCQCVEDHCGVNDRRTDHCMPPCTTGLQTPPWVISHQQSIRCSALLKPTYTRIFNNLVSGVTIGIARSSQQRVGIRCGVETVVGSFPSNIALIWWMSWRYKHKLRARTRSKCEGTKGTGRGPTHVIHNCDCLLPVTAGLFPAERTRENGVPGNQMYPIIKT